MSKSFLHLKFERTADICGWNIILRFEDNIPAAYKSVVGYTSLQKHFNGGWEVCQITNKSGAEKTLFHAKTKRELLAWFEGIEYGYDTGYDIALTKFK